MNLDTAITDILFRLGLALVVSVSGIMAYRLFSRLTLARARAKAVGPNPARNGKPKLVYFTTPTCAPCRTVQRPAIQRLKAQVGDRVEIVEIDASAQPEVASQWGVLSVPTIFVLDTSGQPRHVNHGVATADKLLRQLNDLC